VSCLKSVMQCVEIKEITVFSQGTCLPADFMSGSRNKAPFSTVLGWTPAVPTAAAGGGAGCAAAAAARAPRSQVLSMEWRSCRADTQHMSLLRQAQVHSEQRICLSFAAWHQYSGCRWMTVALAYVVDGAGCYAIDIDAGTTPWGRAADRVVTPALTQRPAGTWNRCKTADDW
jgi:hypothetical protein